ncbi:uncharacterized protein LOC124360665 [Homalodisca vitripennis]|uniref:uncharacterized protein LOC124360665 n=1 Tax=Homalodisca vitripennis TaxID=197043 RepID=UPI001EECC282|nr:uncharacterized protein LOC124360665 [Homalodisca vitripennis]
MGCGSSKSAVLPLTDDGAPPSSEHITISSRTPQGLAFEVPLHEDSLIKKHPPKRLQRLEEQQVSPPSLRDLQDRLAEAEQRRQQILSQRVASARARQKLKRSDNLENGLLIERMHQEPTTVAL